MGGLGVAQEFGGEWKSMRVLCVSVLCEWIDVDDAVWYSLCILKNDDSRKVASVYTCSRARMTPRPPVFAVPHPQRKCIFVAGGDYVLYFGSKKGNVLFYNSSLCVRARAASVRTRVQAVLQCSAANAQTGRRTLRALCGAFNAVTGQLV